MTNIVTGIPNRIAPGTSHTTESFSILANNCVFLAIDGFAGDIPSFNMTLNSALPTISSITPNTGPTTGGTSVTISGVNFTGATGVTFCGVAATSVTVVNDNTITCNTPAGTAGAVSVVVTTSNGSTPANSLFTYYTAPTVTLNCPANTAVASCQTQSAIDLAFTNWLATASASGGCSGMLTNNNTGAPSACGGSTTVTFTYTSTCAPTTTTCQATFTVTAPTRYWTVSR